MNVKYNHPPSIIKQIPKAISRRISSLSHDKEEFEKAASLYNEALKSSGFIEQLKFHESKAKKPRRNRSRNTIWFNSPYSQTAETNVGKHFLNLVDKHFPRSSFLRKIINRRNVKVIYSCMPNMRSIINRHNAKILGSTEEPSLSTCNCRKNSDCPLDGACLGRNVVYKATMINNSPKITEPEANNCFSIFTHSSEYKK